MSDIYTLRPVNRHFLIVPHVQKNETSAGVLLPEGYKLEEDRYIEASVVEVASDCDQQFRHLKYDKSNLNRVVVDRAMIEEVKLKEKTHYMILENYVVGVYRRPDES